MDAKLSRFLKFVKECAHIKYDEDGDEIDWDYDDEQMIEVFEKTDRFNSIIDEKNKEIETLKNRILQYELDAPFSGQKVKHE